MVDKDAVREWVFGLRSGTYTPIKKSRMYYDKNNKNCGCGVGVLGRIMRVEDTVVLDILCGYKDGNASQRLKAKTIMAKMGVDESDFNLVSEAYESTSSFTEIADYLEAKYLPEDIEARKAVENIRTQNRVQQSLSIPTTMSESIQEPVGIRTMERMEADNG